MFPVIPGYHAEGARWPSGLQCPAAISVTQHNKQLADSCFQRVLEHLNCDRER